MAKPLEYHAFFKLISCLYIIIYFSKVGVVGKINVAIDKSAQQSSVYLAKGPELAVDGIRNSRYDEGSCTHTGVDEPTEGWWEVDLGENYDITSIFIVNRGDCCGARLRNFTIQGGTACVSETKCYVEAYSQIDRVNDTLELECMNFTARYIKVQLHIISPFSLCEVEVYGEISDSPLEAPICRQKPEESTTVIPSASTETSTTELIVTTEKEEEPTTELQLVAQTNATTTIEIVTLPRTSTESPTTEYRATTERDEELTTQLQLAAQTNATIETVNNEICSCSCRTIIIQDANVIAEAIQEIKDNLTVNTVKLSSTRRKKTSAKDERPSATSFGYLGIVVMSVVFGFFVLQDAITAIWYILAKLNIVSEIKVRKVDVKPASPLMPADTLRPAAPGSPPTDSRLAPR